MPELKEQHRKNLSEIPGHVKSINTIAHAVVISKDLQEDRSPAR